MERSWFRSNVCGPVATLWSRAPDHVRVGCGADGIRTRGQMGAGPPRLRQSPWEGPRPRRSQWAALPRHRNLRERAHSRCDQSRDAVRQMSCRIHNERKRSSSRSAEAAASPGGAGLGVALPARERRAIQCARAHCGRPSGPEALVGVRLPAKAYAKFPPLHPCATTAGAPSTTPSPGPRTPPRWPRTGAATPVQPPQVSEPRVGSGAHRRSRRRIWRLPGAVRCPPSALPAPAAAAASRRPPNPGWRCTPARSGSAPGPAGPGTGG